MEDRLATLELEVRRLARTIEQLESRLTALEGSGRVVPFEASAAAGSAATGDSVDRAAALVERVDFIGAVSLFGRTLVVLGGAFLLRALTESGTLPPVAGVGLGISYAMLWLVLADRAAVKGARLNAAFHAAASALISFPLVAEAGTRFALIDPTSAAGLLAVVTVASLAVAWRRSQQAVAWFSTIAATTTAMLLMVNTGVVVPYAAFMIVLGLGTLWLGYDREWIALRWPVALVADFVVVGLALRATAKGATDPAWAVIAVQLFLLTSYVCVIAARTLVRGRNVIPFEVFQTVAALVVGLGGASYVATVTGAGAALLGLITVVFGFVCYGVAFAFVERREGSRHNFYFYTTLAMTLILVGSALISWGPGVALAWALLAAATTMLGRRFARACLVVHGVVYCVAAALAAGLLATAMLAFVGSITTGQLAVTVAALLVLAASIVVSVLMPVPEASVFGGMRFTRLVSITLVAWCLGAVIIAWVAPVLAAAREGVLDPGTVATIRTAVLAAAAFALAMLGRTPRFREASWLVYPVLALGGLKLLVEDLSRSHASTLFAALVLYGLALVFAPRLNRASAAPSQRAAA